MAIKYIKTFTTDKEQIIVHTGKFQFSFLRSL